MTKNSSTPTRTTVKAKPAGKPGQPVKPGMKPLVKKPAPTKGK